MVRTKNLNNMETKNVSEAISVSQRHRHTGWFCGELAHRTTLRKRCSSQGMQSFESAMKSYSSWAWSNKALKSGWWSKPILITYLLCFSPTYTTKWPFGTSLGILEHPSWREHHQPLSQHSSQDMHLFRHIFLHLFRHPLRNLDFIVSFKRERKRERRRWFKVQWVFEVVSDKVYIIVAWEEPMIWSIKWLTWLVAYAICY